MLLNRKILSEYSPYPTQYDLTEVMQYVDLSEKIHIIPLIGNAMYDELCEEVKNNNLTPENATLLVEALYPLLGFAVAYEALPLTWASVTEIGVVKGHSDNSDSLSLKDMTYVSEHLKRQLQARGDYALEWIKDRIEYYPLIAQCTSCKCSCQPKDLYKPKSFQQLYSPRRRNTDIR
jgi:hypothetical protein